MDTYIIQDAKTFLAAFATVVVLIFPGAAFCEQPTDSEPSPVESKVVEPAQSDPPPVVQPDKPENSEPAELPPPVAFNPKAGVPLIVSGATVLGLSYGLPLGIVVFYFSLVWPFQAAFGDPTPVKEIAWLFVPIVGPIVGAQTDYMRSEPGFRTVYYVDAGLQAVGLTLLTAGLIVRNNSRSKARKNAGSAWIGPGPGNVGVTFGWQF